MVDQAGVPEGYERVTGYERFPGPDGPPVPGTGPILSTFEISGDVFACRLTDGEPALYRAVPGGWEIVQPKCTLRASWSAA